MSVRQVIVVSDLHCGCRMGLCPPAGTISLDEGGGYTPSELQRKVWAYWEEFWWDWVPKVTRGESWALVVNGDAIEGVHHGANTMISNNITDQVRIAKTVLKPQVERAAMLFFVRGTEVHVGKGGEDEETLAELLGAQPDRTGRHSRFELRLQLDRALVDFQHHIATVGSNAYETTALQKEFVIACEEAGRWGQEAPDVIVRCLSEDTELLTRDGWCGIDGIEVGDEVLTMHSISGKLQWQETSDKVVNAQGIDQRMVHVTGKGQDILVTPDHSMLIRSSSNRRGEVGWKTVPAVELCEGLSGVTSINECRLEIPVPGKCDGTPVSLTGAELVPYSGRTWCVCVPNETLVIRRNGCVAIVGNSHRHRYAQTTVPTRHGEGMVVTTPGWQLKTPLTYRMPGARQSTPQFGGILVRCGNEDIFVRSYVKTIQRAPIETIDGREIAND